MNVNETHNAHTETEMSQSQTPTPAGAQNTSDSDHALSGLQDTSNWSWGGLMFGPAYLIATKNYLYLLLYLFMFVPFLNLLAFIGIPVFIALKGHDFVAGSSMFKNDQERNGFNRAIDHAGLVMFLITLVFFLVAFVGALFMVSMFGGMIGGSMNTGANF